MKKMMMTLVAMLTIAVNANAMSYEQARNEALFLTDKMAYELNLTDEQYEAAYEINLDYLMGVTSRSDVFGTYWERRNLDLSYILLDWQWEAFLAANYFYRPLYWDAGYWHFAIYARYPHRDYFYFGFPHFYTTYRGGHAWHVHGGHGYYYGRREHFRAPVRQGGQHIGMHDRWDRGDFSNGHRSSTRVTGRSDMNRGNRSIDRGTNRSIDRGNNRSIDRGTNRSIDRGNNRSIDRGTNRSIDRGTNRTIDRSTNRTIDRSSSRTIDRSSSRTIDRSTNRSFSSSPSRSIGSSSRSSSLGSPRSSTFSGSRSSGSFSSSRSSGSFSSSRSSGSFSGSRSGGSFSGGSRGGSFGGGSHGGGSHGGGGGHVGGRR